MTADEKTAELARLNRLLRARDGKPGYTDNVIAIRAAIAALEEEQTTG